jgi:hypothetical protein
MSRSSLGSAGALALVVAFAVSGLAAAQDGEPATAVTNPNTQEVSDMLVPQATA